MPLLLNAGAIVPRGTTGNTPPWAHCTIAPALAATDFPGLIAVGCTWNIAGAPAPCAIVSVASGIKPLVSVGGAPAVDQTLLCVTSNGVPTMPVQNAGQVIVQAL